MPSRWVPLESNPEVLTKWASQVGLSTGVVEFSDVYGLDEDVLSFVPQPVKAVLLVFPLSDEVDKQRREQDKQVQESGQPDIDPTLFFVKQTISNACGTIALLHAIYNSDATIKPGSILQKFQQQAMELTPDERAKLLEETDLFATAHAAAASGGQSAVPENLNTNEHFVAFVQAPDPNTPGARRLIELDGRRPVPLDLGESTDLLRDTAKAVKEVYLKNTSSLTFSMITLGPPNPL